MNTVTRTPNPTPTVQEKFFALGEPLRLSIVSRLAEGPLTAGDLAKPYKVSRPAISRHLRLLRETGLVHAEVHGRQWWYALEPGTLSEMQDYLEDIKQMWGEALHSLKTYVEDQNG